MKQTEIKTKAIRSKRIAWLLRMEGFRILTVRPDRRNPQYDLYFFKATPRFEAINLIGDVTVVSVLDIPFYIDLEEKECRYEIRGYRVAAGKILYSS